MLTRLWWTQSNLNKLQIIITHQFFQKCKLLGNDEFNHLFVRIWPQNSIIQRSIKKIHLQSTILLKLPSLSFTFFSNDNLMKSVKYSNCNRQCCNDTYIQLHIDVSPKNAYSKRTNQKWKTCKINLPPFCILSWTK